MAKRTTRPRLSALKGYSEHHREFLRSGSVIWADRVPGFTKGDDIIIRRDSVDLDACRAAWDVLGEGIQAEWLTERPGSRCWAWWLFDAPEQRRRQLSGGPLYVDTMPDGAKHWSRGLPTAWAGVSEPVVFETEAAFLERHGQLTDFERAELGDFERELVKFPWAGRVAK